MKTREYNRNEAVEYAEKWAYRRNPRYYNFNELGGDCTSFASQCIYAGSKIMNYKKYIGWYYNNLNNRAPSWSGVEFLHDFLINNKGVGPRARKIKEIGDLQIGDLIQLKFNTMERFSHSLIVVAKNGNELKKVFVATHTEDAYHKSVAEYNFESIRFLHIIDIGIW